jgi:glutamyl-tRNA synthetase
MSVICRFAPSPTGRLHVGNVRTALMNWLFVREKRGKFILRIDDTDTSRSTDAYESGIKDDLNWLGLDWDHTFNQSDRFQTYISIAEKLKKNGLLYACYETSEELDRQRKLQRVQGKPPIYNRSGLELTSHQKTAYEDEGRRPHWRFRLSGAIVTWNDMVRGNQIVDTSSLSDPVLIRGDGTFLYTLPSVVDDIDKNITHVIRGEDHVTNSGAQIEVFKALSKHIPTFAHTPLLVGKDGKGLSKRLGSLSMEELKSQGLEPLAICSLLGKIGTSDSIEPRASMNILTSEFSFSKIGRAPARFDEAELELLNGKLLNELSYKDVSAKLSEIGIIASKDFWELIRSNILKMNDAILWNEIIFKEIQGQINEEDKDFCFGAAEMLPSSITYNTWSEWTNALKIKYNRKGRNLFMPLRKALTGLDKGPEMAKLIVLLGSDKARERLRNISA